MFWLLCSEHISCRIIAFAFLGQHWSSSLPLSQGGGGRACVCRLSTVCSRCLAFPDSSVVQRAFMRPESCGSSSAPACVRHQEASEAFQTKPCCLRGDGQRTTEKIRDDLICIYGVVFIDCLLSCACDVTLAFVNSFWRENSSLCDGACSRNPVHKIPLNCCWRIRLCHPVWREFKTAAKRHRYGLFKCSWGSAERGIFRAWTSLLMRLLCVFLMFPVDNY